MIPARQACAHGPRRRGRGQAMVEFAFAVPVILFVIFGLMEGSLLVFGITTARFAAAEAAKTLSEAGSNLNADSLALTSIQNSPAGALRVITIQEIDIYQMVDPGNGVLVQGAKLNQYDGSYNLISGNYPPAARSTKASQPEYVGVSIKYQFKWKDGLFAAVLPAVTQTTSSVTRLEPVTF